MSPTRKNALFISLGVLFVGGVTALSSLRAEESPILHLPIVPTSSASVSPAPPPLVDDKAPPRLMRHPALSATHIAFDFAGEIWTVPRGGGDARRLVTGQLHNSSPIFSPDGKTIAFTGGYDGSNDVYIVAASGGEPRRLTYHPGMDVALGFTPDGSRVLFWSMRATPRDLPHLFTVGLTGGFPEEVPLPSGAEASYAPDGKHLAYVPFQQWQPEWRKYRGGQATPIWLADLADSQITKVPRQDSNDRRPMWIGDTVYFLSDRNGPTTLFAYDTKGGASAGAVREVIPNPHGFEIRSASAGPGAIVYEQVGKIGLFDLSSGKTTDVHVNIAADLPQERPRFVHVEFGHIRHAALSPTGKRVVVEARGEILAAPAEKGDTRNLTQSPGVNDRSPAWSPDGNWIAWLSDMSGEYALYLRSPDGVGPIRKVDLGDPPSFYYDPVWSPDSKKILLRDKRSKLWLVDLASPKPVQIAENKYDHAYLDPTWSPDSRFVAYLRFLDNGLHQIMVYALDEKKAYPVTDARTDAFSPRFDKAGKLLWFLSATDVGMATTDGMTAMGHARTSSVYAAVLRKDTASPLAPESDEEDAGPGSGDGTTKTPSDVKDAKEKADKEKAEKAGDTRPKHPGDLRIDFADIDQRIVAVPLDRANYDGLEAGAEGVVFVAVAPIAASDADYVDWDEESDPPHDVLRFDLKTRKAERFVGGIAAALEGGGSAFQLSADGKTALYAKDGALFVTSADKPAKDGDGRVKIEAELYVDPRADWREVYREVWRIERDYLYDPNAHGLDLKAAEKTYEPFLAGIAGRDDLNALLEEGLANIVLGHVWAEGGAMPSTGVARTGLLGADYKIEDGRYRIARILRGENWNPHLKAPLTEPGVDVHEGDFILAIDGQELRGDDDISRLLQKKAGVQTLLTVASRAVGGLTRNVKVIPTPSEGGLRLRTWMEDNRKKVLELSGGRVGYVYIPDTQGNGFQNFNRYYFSEVGKDGVVLDERFNHGGQIADYMVETMQWQPLMGAATREGQDTVIPRAVFSAKAMIANQMSGSGGDALPWLFKRLHIGPLVGTRTWGGLVGIGGYPRLIDGGRVTAPRWGLYGVGGEWEVENHGVAPDIEVDQDPALVRQGHDPQLERAVQVVLDQLAKNPPKKLVRPAFPNYGSRLPTP